MHSIIRLARPYSTLKDTIKSELKAAMLAKNTARVDVLKVAMTELHRVDKEAAEGTASLSVHQQTMVKLADKWKKVVDEYHNILDNASDPNLKAQTQTMLAKEQGQLEIIRSFLAKQMEEQEIEALVLATIDKHGLTTKKDISALMKILTAETDAALVPRKSLTQFLLKHLK